jgi:hypothetical protein
LKGAVPEHRSRTRAAARRIAEMDWQIIVAPSNGSACGLGGSPRQSPAAENPAAHTANFVAHTTSSCGAELFIGRIGFSHCRRPFCPHSLPLHPVRAASRHACRPNLPPPGAPRNHQGGAGASRSALSEGGMRRRRRALPIAVQTGGTASMIVPIRARASPSG